MSLIPKVVKNLLDENILLNDVQTFDDGAITLPPGVNVDLLDIASDEDLAKSFHLKHLQDIGAIQVIETFDTSATQSTALSEVTGLATTGAAVDTSAAAPPTAGQVLTATDSTHAIWEDLPPSGGTPAGNSGAVQFNDAGSFGGDETQLFWDNASKALGLGTGSPSHQMHIKARTSPSEASFRMESLTSAADFTLEANESAQWRLINNNLGATTAFYVSSADSSLNMNAPLNATSLVASSFLYSDGNQASGKVLTSDASGNATWQTASGGGTPAGSDREIQFNNSGAFGSDAGLKYEIAPYSILTLAESGGSGAQFTVISTGGEISMGAQNTDSAVRFNINGGTRMFFANSSNSFNIGIGTDTPAATLDVAGQVNSTNFVGGDFTTTSGSLNAFLVNATGFYQANGVSGASGTFTTVDSKTVTVSAGIITSIV